MVALLRTTLGLRVPGGVRQSGQEFTSLSAGLRERLDLARVNARAFDRAALGDLPLCLRHLCLPSQRLRVGLLTLEDISRTATAHYLVLCPTGHRSP